MKLNNENKQYILHFFKLDFAVDVNSRMNSMKQMLIIQLFM
jgi:hypothetical protein